MLIICRVIDDLNDRFVDIVEKDRRSQKQNIRSWERCEIIYNKTCFLEKNILCAKVTKGKIVDFYFAWKH